MICKKCALEYERYDERYDEIPLCYECYLDFFDMKHRFYYISHSDLEDLGIPISNGLLNLSNEYKDKIITRCEETGNIYTTKGFQEAFNSDEIYSEDGYIVILNTNDKVFKQGE